MELRDDIAAARSQMTVLFGARREIRRLAPMLRRDERVEIMAAGKYEGGRGLIALTNKRIIFVKDGWFKSNSQDVSLHIISSVEWDNSLFLGNITIFGHDTPIEITGVYRGDGARFVKAARDRSGDAAESVPEMSNSKSATRSPSPFNLDDSAASAPATASTPVVPEAENALLRLERLSRLRDDGKISEEDFQTFKSKYLS